MEINNTYQLPDKNYVNTDNIKKRIILGNCGSPEQNYIKWTTRYNGKYKKTAAFTIDAAGSIYGHFEGNHSSNYFSTQQLNDESIIILLENVGYLNKIEDIGFIDWLGHIYNKSESVITKKWRGRAYWAPYTDEQLESAVKLVSKLCSDFNIPKVALSHNTKVEDIYDYGGILYKSNVDKYYIDLTPAWPFENFKNKLEDAK